MEKKLLLQQLFDDYVTECRFSRRLRNETVRGYVQVFDRFRRLMPEIHYADDIDTAWMTEFFRRLETRVRIVGKGEERSGVKASTARTYWNRISIFFDWLVVKDLMGKNPLRDMKAPQPEYTDERALRGDQVQKIIAAVHLHAKNVLMLKRDISMIYMLVFCGVRKTEFISLEVRDVDFNKFMLTIRSETSKSKRTRVIPMNRTLVMHLEEYVKERNRQRYTCIRLFVSNNRDVGLTVHGLKHWVKRLNTLSGVDFHLHRFRHTFACNLATQGVHIVKIQRLMGHADIRMTMSYLRSITAEDLYEDVNNKLTIDNLM